MKPNKIRMKFITYVLNWFGYFQIWKEPVIDKQIPLNSNRRRQFNISSPTVFLTKFLSWILINHQFSIIITNISGHSIPPSTPLSVAVFNWIINNRECRNLNHVHKSKIAAVKNRSRLFNFLMQCSSFFCGEEEWKLRTNRNHVLKANPISQGRHHATGDNQ